MIQIRQATFADLDILAPLFDAYRQFYQQASDVAAAYEFLKERFSHGESVIFLAFEGDQALGFTQLYPSFSSVSMARVFILNDLFVAHAGRRKGVATQLMQAALDYAKALGAVRVSLTTATDNANAQATYDAMGWQRDTRFIHYDFQL